MQAKLDQSKPYGQIWGHPEAQYEQGGQLFDSMGEALSQDKLARATSAPDEELTDAKTFLLNLLIGGPMLQGNIKRESEDANLVWSDVQNTANELKIFKYKNGAPPRNLMWRLPEAE